MSSLSVSGATIAFSASDVKSVEYKPEIPFMWITLDDGTQINIPLNICHVIADKLDNVREPRIL